jgi:hypothetical protein
LTRVVRARGVDIGHGNEASGAELLLKPFGAMETNIIVAAFSFAMPITTDSRFLFDNLQNENAHG